jgi:hypothetical protein
MLKLIKIISIILFVPVYSLSQDYKPENLSGTLIIEKKPVEFTYLSTPEGTTEIPCFTYLPTRNEFIANLGKELLPLHGVKNIIITRLTQDESAFVHDSCSGCTLYKAKITFYDQPGANVKSVYLAINHIIWKNSGSGEFYEPRIVELRYLDSIEINE